ncbi:MAG: biopolymer transporter ExbD [Anaerolineales bacterium]
MAMQLGGSGVKSDINVTPFVDIVLVLLIIFMVVTPLLSRALDVSVPPKAVAEITDVVAAEQLILTVKGGADRPPQVFLNQEEIAGGPRALQERVDAIMRGRKDKMVFFQSEPDVPYQFVVDVMDALRGGGVQTIGLITDDKMLATATAGEGAPAPAE